MRSVSMVEQGMGGGTRIPPRLAFALGSRLLRVGGLAIGFLVGQGSVFLALSLLVARGEIEAVGHIGLGFAILSLAQLSADWGATQLLSRHVAVQGDSDYVSASFIVRLVMAVPIFAAAFLFARFAVAEPLVDALVLSGGLVAFIWSLNLQGYLDGCGRTALAGPLSGLGWLAASLALLLVDLGKPVEAGLFVGGAFAGGTALTVAGHFAIAAATGVPIALMRPSARSVRAFARDGALLFLTEIPTQFYGRITIFLVLALLGSVAAGVFVYIRQLITGMIQGIAFIQRVEFPTLAAATSAGQLTLGRSLAVQRWSLALSILSALLLLGAALVLPAVLPASFAPILDNLPPFLLLIPLIALATSVGLIAIARHLVGHYALIANLSVGLGLAIIYACMGGLGIVAVVVAECAVYALRIVYLLAIAGRNSPGRAVADPRASRPFGGV